MKFRLVIKVYGEELPGLGFGLALWSWLCEVWLSHRHLSLLFPKPIAAFLKEAGSWTKNQVLTSFGIRFCFSSPPLICPRSWMLNCLICLQKACVRLYTDRGSSYAQLLQPTYYSFLQFTLRFLLYNSQIESLFFYLSSCLFAHVFLQTYIKNSCLLKLRSSDTSKYANMGLWDISSSPAAQGVLSLWFGLRAYKRIKEYICNRAGFQHPGLCLH